MPSATRVLTPSDAHTLAADHGFPATSDSPLHCTGLEQEWITVLLDDPRHAAPFADVEAAVADLELPAASRITFEPGGQIELSTEPFPALEACDALTRDRNELGAALRRAGIGLAAIGLEPGPRRDRVVRTPRYDAMEAHFDARNAAGRTMMRSTAALQVNVGLDGAGHERWQASHALGPVLGATFANSPFGDSRPSGWRSTRLAVWGAIEGARAESGGHRCRDAWADYALRTPVMLVRTSDTDHVPILEPFPFRTWVADGHELGWPTADDLAYHLTTVFPPVRARGWLELRMIDSVPAPWSDVAAAVTAVLVGAWVDEPALACALAPLDGCWDEAARHGLDDPRFASAATACFAVASERLADAGADDTLLAAFESYRDRYVTRRRCPADDLLDRWHATGEVAPVPENVPEPAWA